MLNFYITAKTSITFFFYIIIEKNTHHKIGNMTFIVKKDSFCYSDAPKIHV